MRAVALLSLVALLLATAAWAKPNGVRAQAVGPAGPSEPGAPTAEIVVWACWGRSAPPCAPDTSQDGVFPFTVTDPAGQVTPISVTVTGGRGAYTVAVLTPGIHRVCEVGR